MLTLRRAASVFDPPAGRRASFAAIGTHQHSHFQPCHLPGRAWDSFSGKSSWVFWKAKERPRGRQVRSRVDSALGLGLTSSRKASFQSYKAWRGKRLALKRVVEHEESMNQPQRLLTFLSLSTDCIALKPRRHGRIPPRA